MSDKASKRQAELERLLQNEPNDPFLRFGLAMEHKKAGRTDEAIAWFDKTLEADASYCYAFYHKAQTLEDAGDNDAAREVYEKGLAAAETHGDDHARSEIQAALDLL